MIMVPEAAIGELVTRGDAFAAVEKVFASMARGSAVNFPVIREAIGHADALLRVQNRDSIGRTSTSDLSRGGYWPGNAERGLTNHQSTVFLFDADTGRCRAVVGGNLPDGPPDSGRGGGLGRASRAGRLAGARMGRSRAPGGVPAARRLGAAAVRAGGRLEP